MRILIVTQGYAPGRGGTERVVQRLAEHLVAGHGDEVTVFTTNCYSGEAFNRPDLPRMPLGEETLQGVRVRRFPVRAWLGRLLERPQRHAYRHRLPLNEQLRAWYQGPIIAGLARAIREERADVIVASSFPLLHMFTALRESRRGGRPCVFLWGALHPHDDWGFGRGMIDRALSEVPCYVASTSFERGEVIRRGARADRVHTVPLGVDEDSLRPFSREGGRRLIGVPDDDPLVGFIGQLGSHKGVDALLGAMTLVWDRLPDARLLIAGARAAFASQIDRTLAAWPRERRKRVSLRYDFPEDEKRSLFAALDVFAYPSGYESFGLAFLEAWAAGKPVIGCRAGAVPDVVRAGHNGLLVPFQHHALLASAILALLRAPTWSRKLGSAGRRAVLDRMTWPHVSQQVRGLLEAVVSRK